MLCYLQILQDGACCNNAVMQVVNAESLEVLRAEMLQELLARCLVGKHPVVHFERAEPCAEVAFKVLFLRTVEEYFLGLEVAQQLLDVIKGAFTRQELTGRYV